MKNEKYRELAKVKVSEKRNIVISKFDDDSEKGITVAQQLQVDEGEHAVSMFFKGAFHIDDIQGLYNLRDACNCAIKKLEEEKSNT